VKWCVPTNHSEILPVASGVSTEYLIPSKHVQFFRKWEMRTDRLHAESYKSHLTVC